MCGNIVEKVWNASINKLDSKHDSLWITSSGQFYVIYRFRYSCEPFFQFYSLFSGLDTVVVFSKFTCNVSINGLRLVSVYPAPHSGCQLFGCGEFKKYV